jgi:hypothetical protein
MGALTTFRAAGYLGILLNLSAAMGAVINIDILGELPTRAWRKWKGGLPELNTQLSDSSLLGQAGMDFRWSLSSVHFTISFALGCICATIQVGTLAWINLELSSVRWVLMIGVIWGSLPLVIYFFASFLIGFFTVET